LIFHNYENNRVIPLFLILNKTFYFFLFRNGRTNGTKKEKKGRRNEREKGRRNESYKQASHEEKETRKMNNHLNQKNHSSDFFDYTSIGAWFLCVYISTAQRAVLLIPAL
jgi:hypothetical protein